MNKPAAILATLSSILFLLIIILPRPNLPLPNIRVRRKPTESVDYEVTHLFDREGCSVYRFTDGRYRYFVKCDCSSTINQTYAYGNTWYGQNWIPDVVRNEEVVTGYSCSEENACTYENKY